LASRKTAEDSHHPHLSIQYENINELQTSLFSHATVESKFEWNM